MHGERHKSVLLEMLPTKIFDVAQLTPGLSEYFQMAKPLILCHSITTMSSRWPCSVFRPSLAPRIYIAMNRLTTGGTAFNNVRPILQSESRFQ